MSNQFGKKFRLTFFGESHGPALGVVMDGVPAGTIIEEEVIQRYLDRRRPGTLPVSSARKESDQVRFLSGVFRGRATGTAISAVIWNENQHSAHYEEVPRIARPGHADYTGHIKYRGFEDFRGGGSFSGRITACFVIAGSIARSILEEQGIFLASHIASIGSLQDTSWTDAAGADENNWRDLTATLNQSLFPVIDPGKGEAMRKLILQCREEGDSIGGSIECVVYGLPAGLGEPYFDSMESTISHLAFSVPAVKGIEFGSGARMAAMRGSEANDPFYLDETGRVRTRTNHNGGINGGITNGMPILFTTYLKPTPSIAREQESFDLETQQACSLAIRGRHDPCIVQRAAVVMESVAAIAVLEHIL